MASGKILVAQGGGPTAVINQSLVGVALEARRFGAIERIYGARHGVRGIVDEGVEEVERQRPGAQESKRRGEFGESLSSHEREAEHRAGHRHAK